MSSTHKRTILLVEDEVGFRRVFQDALAYDGYNVLVAEDGESGWQLAKSEKPGLILLDLVLPGLHGFEVLRNIRADATTKDTPVIILTVLGEEEDVRKGLELGANDYMTKGSYSPREILMRIRLVLATSGTRLLAAPDIMKRVRSYKLSVREGRADAARLQQDICLPKLFRCPHCKEEMSLELIPDYTRPEGHWFSAHFVCPRCEVYF